MNFETVCLILSSAYCLTAAQCEFHPCPERSVGLSTLIVNPYAQGVAFYTAVVKSLRNDVERSRSAGSQFITVRQVTIVNAQLTCDAFEEANQNGETARKASDSESDCQIAAITKCETKLKLLNQTAVGTQARLHADSQLIHQAHSHVQDVMKRLQQAENSLKRATKADLFDAAFQLWQQERQILTEARLNLHRLQYSFHTSFLNGTWTLEKLRHAALQLETQLIAQCYATTLNEKLKNISTHLKVIMGRTNFLRERVTEEVLADIETVTYPLRQIAEHLGTISSAHSWQNSSLSAAIAEAKRQLLALTEDVSAANNN